MDVAQVMELLNRRYQLHSQRNHLLLAEFQPVSFQNVNQRHSQSLHYEELFLELWDPAIYDYW